ncbi:hypothetical protein R3W88_026726 [Solanum pinnatisectum]|uniref:SAUR family protein n=1 Tax=Solanum pinnatisectum TaxID=50273 RepID=A0AAV9LF78_9SOLN|nr:hypothetical protein R3W88_026726 [Solanum pinnatisectum]
MTKLHGFVLKNHVTSLICAKSLSRFLRWTQRLKTICFKVSGAGSERGYVQIGHKEKVSVVPKGHMAIYVGQKDGDCKRFLVPVIYFNHPLFSELLREVEDEYGFNYSGGITIPCRISEFEHVQTRIKQGWVARKMLTV